MTWALSSVCSINNYNGSLSKLLSIISINIIQWGIRFLRIQECQAKSLYYLLEIRFFFGLIVQQSNFSIDWPPLQLGHTSEQPARMNIRDFYNINILGYCLDALNRLDRFDTLHRFDGLDVYHVLNNQLLTDLSRSITLTPISSICSEDSSSSIAETS